MQTWTLVRFLHIAGVVFFAGGQLVLATTVAPALRRRADDETLRLVVRRLGLGNLAALALAVATGVAMASHFSLWSSDTLQLKLVVLVLVAVVGAFSLLSPTSLALVYLVGAGALLVVWLGVKLTYG